MSSTVYANDRSICCKAGPGASYAASPDTCWTPPQPGPVPIPYPNTSYSTDLTNGTKTVFIEGTEVAKKDVSYFATSTGDEPATSSCGQGIATGVIKGKAYFFSWSMNVKAEKHNVCRHIDMMGHNHASFPSNTPLFPFVERGLFSHPCAKEEERIKRACKKEEDEKDEDKSKLKIKRKKRFDVSKILKAGKIGPTKKGPWHWTDDHCDGLNLPIDDMDPQKYVDTLKESYKDLLSLDSMLDGAKSMALDYLKNAAMKGLGKVAVRAGVKQLAGSAVPAWGNAVMGIISVGDAAWTLYNVGDIKTLAADLIDDIDAIKSKLGDFKSLIANASKDPEALMWDGMDILATVNSCLRARKCNLVPYSKKGGRGSNVETSSKGGCCPGQTGHHLIPQAMVKDGPCPNYDHGEAPTVCVEGRTQNYGSHKRIHDVTNALLQKIPKTAAGKVSMKNAIDTATAAHIAAFPLSRCSPKCIKAQLEAYYKVCNGADLNPLTPSGKVDKAAGAPAND